MKRIAKTIDAPQSLQKYTAAFPNASWREMCNDNEHYGSNAAGDCRRLAYNDQYFLCAYCERKIFFHKPPLCQIEHFHQKSDTTSDVNQGIDWQDMFAVCDGGRHYDKQKLNRNPITENLSCDQHKNYFLQKSGIPPSCKGYILNPLKLPSYPNLFTFHKRTGHLEANEEACATIKFDENEYNSLKSL